MRPDAKPGFRHAGGPVAVAAKRRRQPLPFACSGTTGLHPGLQATTLRGLVSFPANENANKFLANGNECWQHVLLTYF